MRRVVASVSALALAGGLLTAVTVAAAPVGAQVGDQPAPANYELSASDTARIERKIMDTSPSDDQLGKASVRERMAKLARCVAIRENSTYCLHIGWMTKNIDEARAYVDRFVARTSKEPIPEAGEPVGEKPFVLTMTEFADQSRRDRLAAERAEIREAIRQAPRIAAEDARMAAAARQENRLLDESGKVMSLSEHFREQETSEWCSGATAHMAGIFHDVQHKQSTWQSMVDGQMDNLVTTMNDNGYDGYQEYAKRIFDGKDDYWSFVKNVDVGNGSWPPAEKGIPMLQSLELFNEFIPYIEQDHDAGHFNVVRAWKKTPNRYIGVFEPFDEQQWSGGAPSAGFHWVGNGSMYSAVEARYNWAAV